jgi:dynein regulatry complex protein 1
MEPQKILTKEERIAQRRARVEARRTNGTSVHTSSESNVTTKQQRVSKIQIGRSRDVVDDLKAEAELVVTNVQVESDAAEMARRTAWRLKRSQHEEHVQSELEKATKANDDINSNWKKVLEHSVPEAMYSAIVEQQNTCQSLLAQKDTLIQMLRTELKAKDEEYDNILKSQTNAVDSITVSMKEESDRLMVQYRLQLQDIERAFATEREELMSKNKKEMDELFHRRRQLELQIIENKLEREERFQKELAEIRARDAEDYNNLKVTLENNIQLLEQQLEEMRATYQLNAEKLEYNHRVLREMDAENSQTVKQHKQKLKKLREQQNSHAAKYAKQEQKFKAENKELTEDYRRMTEQFKDLQRKFRHFERLDNEKYAQVFEMNESETMEHVHKTLKADQLIATQILGQHWQAPSIPSSQHLLSNTFTSGNTSAEKTEHVMLYSNEQIRQALDMLCAEASFLVDQKTLDSIAQLPAEEQKLFTTDAVLSALGVADQEGLEDLVSMFYATETDPEPTIHPNDVVKAVKEYVSSRGSGAIGDTSSSRDETGGGTSREKASRSRSQDKAFWNQLAHILGEQRETVWVNVEKGLAKYFNVLTERSKLVEESTTLAKQNEELRNLLNTYLNSDVNDQLQVPPTYTIPL